MTAPLSPIAPPPMATPRPDPGRTIVTGRLTTQLGAETDNRMTSR